MYIGCIYRHWIVIDGVEVSYIGLHKGTNPQKDRWNGGKGYRKAKGRKKPSKFRQALDEYGWENFNHEIIGWVEAETMKQLALDLDEWEKYYIWKYDSFYNGFNSTTGGSNGLVVSEESKQKQRDLWTEEKRQERSHMVSEYWKNVPEEEMEEIRRKNSNSAKEQWKNMSQEEKEEMRRKLSKGNKKHWQNMTEEQKEEWRLKKIQALNTPETRRNISASKGGKEVICLNTLEVFPSSTSACKFGGVKTGVTACCKGRQASAGIHPETGEDLKWMYLCDYNEASDEALKIKHEAIKKRKRKEVICLNTLEVFPDGAVSSRWAGVKGGVIPCCQGKMQYAGKHPETGEKLRWMYYDEYLKQNPTEKDLIQVVN